MLYSITRSPQVGTYITQYTKTYFHMTPPRPWECLLTELLGNTQLAHGEAQTRFSSFHLNMLHHFTFPINTSLL